VTSVTVCIALLAEKCETRHQGTKFCKHVCITTARCKF